MRGYNLMLATGLAVGAPGVAESRGIAYCYVAFTPAASLGTTKDGLGFRLACRENERYKRKAEEIAAAIRGTDGVALTVRAIEAMGI